MYIIPFVLILLIILFLFIFKRKKNFLLRFFILLIIPVILLFLYFWFMDVTEKYWLNKKVDNTYNSILIRPTWILIDQKKLNRDSSFNDNGFSAEARTYKISESMTKVKNYFDFPFREGSSSMYDSYRGNSLDNLVNQCSVGQIILRNNKALITFILGNSHEEVSVKLTSDGFIEELINNQNGVNYNRKICNSDNKETFLTIVVRAY